MSNKHDIKYSVIYIKIFINLSRHKQNQYTYNDCFKMLLVLKL